MRPTLFTTVISFDEALRAVMAAAVPMARTEVVGLEDIDGRVVAEDIVSPADVPAFDRAAMDGYAVIADDTAGAAPSSPRTLECVGRLFTGDALPGRLARGQCVEVATGAPVPVGTTAVIMVEQTRAIDDGRIEMLASVTAGQNVSRRGADMTQGQMIVPAGGAIGPSRVGAVAATGVASVRVFAQRTVAILSTGNEIVSPGQPLGAGQVYDINRYTLQAVVRRHGGAPTLLPAAGDTLAALHASLDAVAGHDIAVFSGGSSVGERDLMVDALRTRGTIIFHGIAVKPGKPTLFARMGDTLVFGMPGSPSSCLSNAYILLVPLLRAMARLPQSRPQTIMLPLSRRVSSTLDRHQFYTVRIVEGQAEPAFKASGDITSMANADGFIEIPAGTDSVAAGTLVSVKIF